MKRYVLLLCVLIVLVACKETIHGETEFYFDNPQPINDSELSELPSKLRGLYTDGKGRFLNITESMIYDEYNAMYHKSMIDSVGVLENGKFTASDTHEVFDAEIKGDSVYLKGVSRNTVFEFSPTQKAKRINGHLVLSNRDSIFWKVSIISLENDSLKIKYLSDREDFNQIKPLVENIKVNEDTTVVRINPTRREFGRMLKIREFGREQGYIKVK